MCIRDRHEHVLAADILVDFDEDFLVGEAADAGVRQLDLQIVRNGLGQRQVGVAGQQFHARISRKEWSRKKRVRKGTGVGGSL